MQCLLRPSNLASYLYLTISRQRRLSRCLKSAGTWVVARGMPIVMSLRCRLYLTVADIWWTVLHALTLFHFRLFLRLQPLRLHRSERW